YAGAWSDAPYLFSDSAGYMRVARDLQDLRLDKLHERTPGYALLLLPTGSATHPTRLLFYAQLVIHYVAVLLLVGVLCRLGVRTAFVIPVVIVSMLPPAVEPSSWVLTEALTEFFLASGVAALLAGLVSTRSRWFWLSGVALAFCSLTRPTFQLLGFLLAVVMLLLLVCCPTLRRVRKRFLLAIVALLVTNVMIVGGFVLHNYVRFQYPGITAALGFHLGTRTLRVLERLPDEHALARDVLIAHRDRALVKPHSGHSALGF
ncbi:unnamed protein product, partial [marine sediment metagenome]